MVTPSDRLKKYGGLGLVRDENGVVHQSVHYVSESAGAKVYTACGESFDFKKILIDAATTCVRCVTAKPPWAWI
jgi:hypothetical protein